ncbi:hypothetical protein ACIA58_40495 [Kribbella sp. NPDC051586]|uniref:hypothetical protein n=1 Tax=Kribbella sp. NPDC051586 TaxID=3364118 RepID=UPI0037893EDD
MRAGSWRTAVTAAVLLLASSMVGGCQVGPAPPAAAVLRTSAPPWDAPRDAVSYIDKAGFEQLPLDFSGPSPYTVHIAVAVDGKPVEIPAGIGIDKLRAEQAAVHTHTTDGVVWVESKTTSDHPTLAQFFTLWGVRYDANCLADACAGLKVAVNGAPAAWDTPLVRNGHITVSARS